MGTGRMTAQAWMGVKRIKRRWAFMGLYWGDRAEETVNTEQNRGISGRIAMKLSGDGGGTLYSLLD